MTKLLYITNGINGAGGLERVLAVKASYLVEHYGYDVTILCLNDSHKDPFYTFSDKIKMCSITVVGNPIKYILAYKRGIQKIVKEIKPDVISVCDDGLKGFFMPKILFNKIPIIYERHVSKIIELGEDPSFFKRAITKVKFFMMNMLAEGFDKFIVLTKDNIEEWSLKNIAVISNPLSFYPKESSDLQSKNVIAVGKQGLQKGYDRLLNSWKIVNQLHPDWKLSIYGTFESSQNLVELSQKLKIENSVCFYEPVKKIEDKFLESSIFVFSSRFEGFGMVLIEAMACGLPCVSFDCPCGPREIIKNNEDGFLITNGDQVGFAEKIIFLIENKHKREQMGLKAKENVKRYLPETIVKQWDDLFRSLLK